MMCMKKLFLLIALIPLVAQSQQLPGCELVVASNFVSPASARLRFLLKEKNFAALEDELNEKLTRYEQGQYSDLSLFRDMKSAVEKDVSLEPLLAQWVAAKPKSYFARVMKGLQHSYTAFEKRGSNFADKTSVEQMSAMRNEFDKALVEYKAALEIKPKFAIAMAGIMSPARALGGAEATTDVMTRSEREDSQNLSARNEAIFSLAPKWGGSFEALDAIVVRANQAKLSEASLRYLRYRVESEKANHFEVVTKEKNKSIQAWRRAAAHCTAVEIPWSNISRLATDIEDWATVQETANRAIAVSNSPTAIQRRGWASEKLGQMPDAIKDYQAAADLGEPWSQARLGYFYMLGQHVPKDVLKARALLESAIAKGNAHARQSLDWLNRQSRVAK